METTIDKIAKILDEKIKGHGWYSNVTTFGKKQSVQAISELLSSGLMKDILDARREVISSPIRFDGVSTEDIKRIFAEHGIEFKQPF